MRNKEDIIAWSVAVLIVILLLGFSYISFIKSSEYTRNLCAESLGVEYSWWDGFQNLTVDYVRIDESKYNCCWVEKEPILTDDGYVFPEGCKGFIR